MRPLVQRITVEDSMGVVHASVGGLEPAAPDLPNPVFVLPFIVGKERAVAATKTYLNSIAAVALLSTVATGDRLPTNCSIRSSSGRR